MKFFVAFLAIAAVAVAEPESDAQFVVPSVYSHGVYPYAQQYVPYAHSVHATAGMKTYANGAVVPDDTLSVKAAKVQHHNAKASEYAKKSIYTHPVYSSIPTTTYGHIPATTYGHISPYVYGVPTVHRVARDADSQVYTTYPSVYGHAYSGVYSPYTTAGYTYPSTYGYPSAYAGVAGYVNPYVSTGVYGHRFVKRDADSQIVGYPYTGIGSVYGYPSAYSTAYTGSYVRPAVTYSTGYQTYSPYSVYGNMYNGLRYQY